MTIFHGYVRWPSVRGGVWNRWCHSCRLLGSEDFASWDLYPLINLRENHRESLNHQSFMGVSLRESSRTFDWAIFPNCNRWGNFSWNATGWPPTPLLSFSEVRQWCPAVRSHIGRRTKSGGFLWQKRGELVKSIKFQWYNLDSVISVWWYVIW